MQINAYLLLLVSIYLTCMISVKKIFLKLKIWNFKFKKWFKGCFMWLEKHKMNLKNKKLCWSTFLLIAFIIFFLILLIYYLIQFIFSGNNVVYYNWDFELINQAFNKFLKNYLQHFFKNVFFRGCNSSSQLTIINNVTSIKTEQPQKSFFSSFSFFSKTKQPQTMFSTTPQLDEAKTPAAKALVKTFDDLTIANNTCETIIDEAFDENNQLSPRSRIVKFNEYKRCRQMMGYFNRTGINNALAVANKATEEEKATTLYNATLQGVTDGVSGVINNPATRTGVVIAMKGAGLAVANTDSI